MTPCLATWQHRWQDAADDPDTTGPPVTVQLGIDEHGLYLRVLDETGERAALGMVYEHGAISLNVWTESSAVTPEPQECLLLLITNPPPEAIAAPREVS